MTTQPTNSIDKVQLCNYCDGADPDCKYYDSKNHYVVKPAKFNSIDSELEEIFNKLNGSGAHACYCERSTDGGCKCALKDEYITKALQAIKALYRKEVEEAIGETYLPHCITYPEKYGTYCNNCIACKNKDNADFNDGYEYKANELRAKLLPPTNTEDK